MPESVSADATEGAPAEHFRWAVFGILRGGAILATVLLTLGLLRYASLGHEMPVDTPLHEGVKSFAFAADLRRGDPLALCTLGVFVLVCLPIARVVLSFFFFLRTRDHLYSVLTALVLLLVLAGTILGKAL